MDSSTKTDARHVIWWIKKDFRLRDNPALAHALNSRLPVVPVFMFEPSALEAPETSDFHIASWIEAIEHLRQCFRTAGSDLLILDGEVVSAFTQIAQAISIAEIVSHEEVGTERTYARDRAVSSWCRDQDIEWTELRQTGVFRTLQNRDHRSKLWQDFMRAPVVPEPSPTDMRRVSVPSALQSLPGTLKAKVTRKRFGVAFSRSTIALRQRVTEADAQKTLADFLSNRAVGYSAGISSPNTAFATGSRLSVHLAWGTISPRDVLAALDGRTQDLADHPDAKAWRRSLNAFRARMHWRDHFIQRLETEPSMEIEPLNPAYEQLPTTQDHLDAWCEGRTGFPMVDACIRCAQTTGFLNFRMRCMITSVACHTLRLNWKDIMWPMARWWADYEPGIHVAQLQMQAGLVGINTLRTYSPAKQILDHDPKTTFVKRWLPELKSVAPEDIIAHQQLPIKEYIDPAVDWKTAVASMRADYYAIKRQPETKLLAEKILLDHGSRKPAGARSPTKSGARRKRSPP